MNIENAADWMDSGVTFLTGAFPYSAEFQNVGMAVQGAMNVRKGPNKNQNLHWFHAFCLSVVAAFGGGIFNFIWLGKPSALVANDLCMASCIIAFVLVNVVPLNLGFMFCHTLPIEILTTSSAQLFRSLGVCKFCKAAFDMFQDSPSAYYPTPVFGPIVYAILLGNMGPFLVKGFEGHVANGMPWAVQNGIFCATFYLFYALDTKGPIGEMLRTYLPFAEMLGLDNQTFACAFVGLFMQIMGILQMPEFLGPSFTPFGSSLLSPFLDSTTWRVGRSDSVYAAKQRELKVAAAAATSPANNTELTEEVGTETESEGGTPAKRKRKKKKKKNNAPKEKEL